MITRRKFLKASGAVGAGFLVPWKWSTTPAFAAMPTTPNLKKYVDPLPIPPVINATGGGTYTIPMDQGMHQFHSSLGFAQTWGYGGATYLGPTFEVRKDVPITVNWINNLPTNGHLFPVDFTLHWANPTGLPATAGRGTAFPIPVVPHVHGGRTLPQFDGHPEAWFTSGLAYKGPHFVSDTYVYGNDQRAATIWYHDHALGITRLNVYAGLAGFYLIRDEFDTGVPGTGLNLPKGSYEIPLVIQDKIFNPDGSLFYPVQEPVPAGTPPVWLPELFGDTPVVNGKAYPFLEVEPRRYRFRIVNGSNARFYELKLVTTPRNSILPFYQIGNDGGFLPAPVLLSRVLLAPGERADIIVDFANVPRDNEVLLKNNARAPDPDGRGGQVNQLVRFRVTLPLSGTDATTSPAQLILPPITPLPASSVTRNMVLEERLDTDDNPIVLLVERKFWHEPVGTQVQDGATEEWLLINITGDTHPIHLHLVTFEVIDRQPFDVDAFAVGAGPLVFTGPSVPRDPNEAGRKDTVRANPGEITRIRVTFNLPTYAPGIQLPLVITHPQYVWHCHILEHEDNEMMRPYELIAGG